MEVDPSTQTSNSFQCNICGETFTTRGGVMKHKKMKHLEKVDVCDKFLKGECPRKEESCWHKHPLTVSDPKFSKNLVFQNVLRSSVPPDQMTRVFQMVTSLCTKVEKMEKNFLDMVEEGKREPIQI